jgi:hypothetical protein
VCVCVFSLLLRRIGCTPVGGTRRYLVSTFEEFYRRYSMERPETRHYYEVIREGCACHLYFDLEFDRSSNVELTDTDALMGHFRALLFSAMLQRFGIRCSRKDLIELVGKLFVFVFVSHSPSQDHIITDVCHYKPPYVRIYRHMSVHTHTHTHTCKLHSRILIPSTHTTLCLTLVG